MSVAQTQESPTGKAATAADVEISDADLGDAALKALEGLDLDLGIGALQAAPLTPAAGIAMVIRIANGMMVHMISTEVLSWKSAGLG